jgi:hypothetical protein
MMFLTNSMRHWVSGMLKRWQFLAPVRKVTRSEAKAAQIGSTGDCAGVDGRSMANARPVIGVAVLAACVLMAIRAPIAFAAGEEAEINPQNKSPQGGPTPGIHEVPIPEQLAVSLLVVPTYGNAPMTTGFLASVTVPEDSNSVVSFNWNFGDGQVSTSPVVPLFHVYQNPGTYIVTLVVTTSDGLTATAVQGVVVRPSQLD